MPYRLWLEDIVIILSVLSNLFTTSSQNGIILSQSEKVIASRGKLNYLTLANDSTPLNRAFFVRDIRTPKEFADFVLFNLKILFLLIKSTNLSQW